VPQPAAADQFLHPSAEVFIGILSLVLGVEGDTVLAAFVAVAIPKLLAPEEDPL
jgi:hypothetical protein